MSTLKADPKPIAPAPMPEAAGGLRPPRQRRSRDSLDRVMRAGLELLREGGYEAFTIAELSRRAGVSVGTVYGRFASKRALFLAIHRGYVEQMNGEWSLTESEANSLPTPELIRRLVSEVVGGFERHGRTLRVFMLRAGTDEDVYKQAQEGIALLSARFNSPLLARADQLAHPDPKVGADVAFHMVFGTAARRAMYGSALESGIELSWTRLADEMGTACVAYLLGAE